MPAHDDVLVRVDPTPIVADDVLLSGIIWVVRDLHVVEAHVPHGLLHRLCGLIVIGEPEEIRIRAPAVVVVRGEVIDGIVRSLTIHEADALIGEDEIELNLLVPCTDHEIRSGRLGVDDEEAHLVNGGIEGHVSEAVDPIGVLHEDRGPRDDRVLGVRLDREVGHASETDFDRALGRPIQVHDETARSC